jgi:hypothetical protein
MATDSGMPSMRAPTVIAAPEASSCWPRERLRSRPPARLTATSAAKYAPAPRIKPSDAAPKPPSLKASSMSSKATEETRTPAPRAMEKAITCRELPT